MELSDKQKENIRKSLEDHGIRFQNELANGEWKQDRKDRTALFQTKLSKESLPSLTEKDFAILIETLWASSIWGKKEYHSGKVIAENGIEKIRNALMDLLYGEDSVAKRYDKFRQLIKGLGPSSITEIMIYVDPEKYSLWNSKPKNILPFLGLDKLLPDNVFKYQIEGKNYEQCHEALTLLKRRIEETLSIKLDFLDLDIFLWLLFNEVNWDTEKPEVETKHLKKTPTRLKLIDPHWDSIAVLADLGNILGYDTYVADPSRNAPAFGKKLGEIATLGQVPSFTLEKHLETIKNIDIIWFEDEFPVYCFEVEHTTGVTLGLLRLFQIRQSNNAK